MAVPHRESLFECKISGAENIKTFSSILHYLRVLGKELLVEATRDVLTFRTLNEAKTAYTSVSFHESFFELNSYHLNVNTLRGNNEDGRNEQDVSFSGKMMIKYLVAITKSFRHAYTLKFTAEKCQTDYEFVFQLQGANRIVKTYRFKYSDTEVISAVFDDSQASHFRSMTKVLAQLFDHMHHSPEITILATPDTFHIQSYHTPSETLNESKNHLDTDVTLDVNDFDFYHFYFADEADNFDDSQNDNMQRKKEFVCCIRELKAFLSLSDAVNIDEVDFFFVEQGKPVKMFCTGDSFQVALIVTTIEPRTSNIANTTRATSQSSRTAPAPQSQQQSSPFKSQKMSQSSQKDDDKGTSSSHSSRMKQEHTNGTTHTTMAQQYDDDEEDTADEGEVVAKKKMKASSMAIAKTSVFEKDHATGNGGNESDEDPQEHRSSSSSNHRRNTLILSQSQGSQNSIAASQNTTANILAGMKGHHLSNSPSTSPTKGRKSKVVLMDDDSD